MQMNSNAKTIIYFKTVGGGVVFSPRIRMMSIFEFILPFRVRVVIIVFVKKQTALCRHYTTTTTTTIYYFHYYY